MRSLFNEVFVDADEDEAPGVSQLRDSWVKLGPVWCCVHVLPRRELLTPTETPGGPRLDELSSRRTTRIFYNDGNTQVTEDDWRSDPVGQQMVRRGEDWTGLTYFPPSTRDDVPLAVPLGDGVSASTRGRKDVDHSSPYRGDLPPFTPPEAPNAKFVKNRNGYWCRPTASCALRIVTEAGDY